MFAETMPWMSTEMGPPASEGTLTKLGRLDTVWAVPS